MVSRYEYPAHGDVANTLPLRAANKPVQLTAWRNILAGLLTFMLLAALEILVIWAYIQAKGV